MQPVLASLGLSKLVWISVATSRAFASTAAVSNRRPARVAGAIRFAHSDYLLEKPVLQDQKTQTKLKNNPEEEDQDLDVTNEARIYLSRASL